MKKRKIRWDKPALIYFSEAIRYISKDSAQNADKVKEEIMEKISELSIRPEIYAPDKYNKTIRAITGLSNCIVTVLLTW
jgi:plasmid stabilization system protein ParE